MSKTDRADERLKDHARKMRSLLDELDRLDVSPAPASDPFRLPYTTASDLRHSDFKLTFPA